MTERAKKKNSFLVRKEFWKGGKIFDLKKDERHKNKGCYGSSLRPFRLVQKFP